MSASISQPEYTNKSGYAPNPTNQEPARVALPSQIVEPSKVDTVPQQASTQPGDGREVHSDPSRAPVPFKEQVIGYAQKTRGTVTRDPQLKEHGEQILQGVTTHEEDKKR